MLRHRLAALALAIAACSLPLSAQQPSTPRAETPQQHQIAIILRAQQDAWNTGSLAAYINFYKGADDTVAVLSNGPIHGLHSIYNAYLIPFPNGDAMGKLAESDIAIRPLGEDFALVTGQYQLTRDKKSGGDAFGTFTDILQNTDLGWRIIYSSTT